jgi:hypothetical protein
VAATGKSGSARVVVACCFVVVDQRSAATALQSEISVAEQDFDDARRGRADAGCSARGPDASAFQSLAADPTEHCGLLLP